MKDKFIVLEGLEMKLHNIAALFLTVDIAMREGDSVLSEEALAEPTTALLNLSCQLTTLTNAILEESRVQADNAQNNRFFSDKDQTKTKR